MSTFKQGDRVRVTGYHLDTPATVLRTAPECGGPFYIVHLDTHAEVLRTLVHASQVHSLARCPECMGQNGTHAVCACSTRQRGRTQPPVLSCSASDRGGAGMTSPSGRHRHRVLRLGDPASGDATVTRRGVYDAYRAAVVTVFVGLGALGFAAAHDASNGLPAGAVVQLGTVVTGHQPGNFNDTATLDTTEVAPGR